MHSTPNQRKSKLALSLGLSCVFGGGVAGSASGANIEWDAAPGVPGNWNVAANWNPDQVPGPAPANDQARISNAGIAVIDATQGVQQVGSVVLGNTLNDVGTLRVTGGGLTTTASDLRIGGNGGGATNGNGVGFLEQSGGDIRLNAGNVNIAIGAVAEPAEGTYTLSSGTLTVDSGFIVAIGNGGTGTLTQTGGSIYVRGASQANPSATTTIQMGRNALSAPSNGTYTLSGGDATVANLTFGSRVQTSGAQATNTFNLSGTGHLTTGAVTFLNTAAANTFNFTGGTLTANNVNIPLVNNGGTLSPAALRFGTTNTTVGTDPAPTTAAGTLVSPVGTTTFSTTYTQAAGTLAIDIAGTGAAGQPTGFDFVNVTGVADLLGTVAVNELNGFDPAVGSTFDVLTAPDIIGTLAPIGTTPSGNTYLASIEPGGNGEVLRLTVAVPEPTTLALLGVATVGLLARRRRPA